MDSPVSVVVGEMVMQNIEEQALATNTHELYLPGYATLTTLSPLHLSYKGEIGNSHEHINRQNEKKNGF